MKTTSSSIKIGEKEVIKKNLDGIKKVLQLTIVITRKTDPFLSGLLISILDGIDESLKVLE